MSEPKFTDGPWHKKGKRVFWQKPDRTLPKDNLFNGLVCICATTEDNPPEVIEEACANAALIAMCPAMYSELEADAIMLRDIAEWLKPRHGTKLVVDRMIKKANDIDAMLAKARDEK